MCYKPVPGTFQPTLRPGLNLTVKRGSHRAVTGMRVVIQGPCGAHRCEGEQRLPEVVVDRLLWKDYLLTFILRNFYLLFLSEHVYVWVFVYMGVCVYECMCVVCARSCVQVPV